MYPTAGRPEVASYLFISSSDVYSSSLKKALQRQGIHVDYHAGIYHLRNELTQASVLLPDSLPLEEKAVQQLLAFAAVRSPDGHQGVCKACATPDFHPGGSRRSARSSRPTTRS